MTVALYDGVATLWRKSGGGFVRSVLLPVRAERTECAKAGAVGPLSQGGSQSDGVVLYAPGAPDVRVGDRLAPYACADAEPPAGAFRVLSVRALTLRGAPHHVEVRAQ